MKRIHKDRPLTKQERLERNAERRRLSSNEAIAKRIEAIGQREDASGVVRDSNLMRCYRETIRYQTGWMIGA